MIMQKTTIMIPADLKTKAVRRARELHVSLGELIRHSLKMSIVKISGGKVNDSLFLDSRVFTDKAPSDLSKNHDQYLYEKDKS